MRMSLPLCQTFGSLETDIDRLPWDDKLVTQAPKYVDGHLIVPNRAGWGTEPIEDGMRAHPPKGSRQSRSAQKSSCLPDLNLPRSRTPLLSVGDGATKGATLSDNLYRLSARRKTTAARAFMLKSAKNPITCAPDVALCRLLIDPIP